ncbi:MAG TPA: chemotaxis protein CheR [Chromatiaceae bacterium]|jgi:chemotaxis protein methyltransferase CheR|nr:chemotaxis protein CheR [Chromatiaceae bacterium]HIO14761.1 chemotaxis protein CheR [Chromatiales bacterium]
MLDQQTKHTAQTQSREFDYTWEHFESLRKISNEHSGIVVTDDKFDMFYSRLSKRLRALNLTGFSEYCALLEKNTGGEFTQFINAVTTNLTSFFREMHHFDYVRAQLIPDLLRQRQDSEKIRIWSSGCSTGEEPYSIAMTVYEAAHSEISAGWDIRVLATDIDSDVLAKAESGVYTEDRVDRLNPVVTKRWFKSGTGENEGMVRVDQSLRDMISFKQLNLMKEWPMKGPLDAIFCRNVIIYFDQETKLKLVNRYADMLEVGGILVLGHSESLYQLTDRFELIGNTVYRRAY